MNTIIYQILEQKDKFPCSTSLLSIAVDKYHDPKYLAVQGSCLFFSILQFSTEESQGRSSRQEHRSKKWSRDCKGMMLSTGLFSMPAQHSSYTAQQAPGASTALDRLNAPASVTNQENALQT